jgi:cytochrome P450
MGAPLARLEARVALGDLLARVKGFQLAGSEPWEPARRFTARTSSLPIRFDPGRKVGE